MLFLLHQIKSRDAPSLVNQKKVEDIVNYNLELGVNTFDHSDQYGSGKIEELFGKAIQSKSFNREEIVISTKAGIVKDGKGKTLYYDLSAKHIKESVNNSLKKLKTDYIDIFLLEHPDFLFDVEETASSNTGFGNFMCFGLFNSLYA